MEMGALVVTAGGDVTSTAPGSSLWAPAWPVLGETVLERWIKMVQGLGVGLVSVVDRTEQQTNRIHTMIEWAREGVERILLIVLGSYAEIDLCDLVRFHYEGQHRVTRVFDQEGPLGISLLDRGCVLGDRERAMNEPPADSVSVRFSRIRDPSFVHRQLPATGRRRPAGTLRNPADRSSNSRACLDRPDCLCGSVRTDRSSVLHRSKSQGQSWCWDPRVLVDRTGLRNRPRYHAGSRQRPAKHLCCSRTLCP